MKSWKNKDGDDDSGDPIRLDCGASRLENLQFLDPGIIDLDCDSDEDCKYIDEDTADINLLGEAPCQSVNTIVSNHAIGKTMCIKLIDCYKFPWYFDRPTKAIIEKKLSTNDNVDIIINEQVIVNSKKFKNLSDVHEIVDINSDYKVVNNSISGPTVTETDDNSIKSKNVNQKCMNKTVDMKRVHEMFNNTHVKVLDHKKRLQKNNKKNDMEILKAIGQRNKTGVDFKKNKGLIGMRIQRLNAKNLTIQTKDKSRKQVEESRKGNEQTLNYLQAVDNALLDIGTSITPIFDEATENIQESKPKICKPQHIDVDSNQKEFKHSMCDATSENDTNIKDLKTNSAQKANDEKNMHSRINETTKIAEEIIRIVTSQNKEKYTPTDVENKICKAMPYSKKIANKRKKMLLDGIVNSLELQKNNEECKMTKLINPIPFPSKGRRKECIKYRTKESQFQNIASPTLETDTNTLNKSFTTLNKFTENILNRIQAKQQSLQYKTNKPIIKITDNTIGKLHKERIKTTKSVDQAKSIGKCKLMSSECTSKANATKDLFSDSSVLITDKKVLNNECPKMSRSLLKKTITNSSYLSPIKTDSLPLNTIIMKTPKTDDAKIDEGTSIINEEKTANFTNAVGPFDKTEQFSPLTKGSQRQTSKNVSPVDIQSIEDPIKIKINSQAMCVLTQQSPTVDKIIKDNFSIQTIITSRNESDALKQSCIQTPINSTVHTPKPKAQVPAMVRSTEAENQAQMKNNLTVHNSMQSHILYKPQVDNRPGHQMFSNNTDGLQYETPIQQINHQFYQQPIWYATWYNGGKEITVDNSPQMFRKVIPPPGGDEPSSSNTAMNARSSRRNCIPPMMPMNSTTMPNGPNTQIEVNTRPPVYNRIAPRTALNNRLHLTPGANGSPQMGMNLKVPGVNGGVMPQMSMSDRPIPQGVYRGIPPVMSTHERYRPPGVCNMQPSSVFWSFPFPPPIPPPPPPPPPFTKTQTVGTSIIGRNFDGIVKKINITAPLVNNCNTKIDIKKESKDDNLDFESDSTPLYDETSTNMESSTLVNTKSEMIRVLDTSIQQIHSPVKDSECTISTLPSKSTANHSKRSLPFQPTDSFVDLKTALPLQSDKIPVNNPKHKLSQQIIEPQKVSVMNRKVLLSSEFNASAVNTSKRTMPVDPNTSCATQSKVLPNKSNQSPVTNLAKVPPFARLFEGNSRPIDNTKKITNIKPLSQVTQSDAPINPKEVTISNYKRERRNSENNERPIGISERNIAISQPGNKVKCVSSTAKYKPGPLSKKIKFNDPIGSRIQTKHKEKRSPNMGYSSPILPIPSYEKILSCNGFDTAEEKIKKLFAETKEEKEGSNMIDKPTEKRKRYEQKSNKINSKKISLDEYKKRSNSERRKDETKVIHSKQKDAFDINIADRPRRASNVDSDLGYDSDSTVKL